MPNYSYYGEQAVKESIVDFQRTISQYNYIIEEHKLKMLDLLTSPNCIDILDTDEMGKCLIAIERVQTKKYEAERMINYLHSIEISQSVDRDENIKRNNKLAGISA